MDKAIKQHLEEWNNYKSALEFQIINEFDEEIKQYYQYRLDSVNYLISKYQD